MTRVRGAWLMHSGTQSILRMLETAGYQALAVGGCVRNELLGAPVSDVDIATDALPDTVMRLAREHGLKAVPTGVDHGTVTVVVAGTGFEVTTFRADVDTDGRHATVRFSTDIVEDARRRDFTMNALYCDATGQVIDPLGGLDDLMARRIRFIGDADQRIREDYLRILRYFRFSAWYGDPGQGFEADTLAEIAGHLDGLDGLSRERVGAEIVKMLSARDPAPAVATMQQVGVLQRCLPGADARLLAPLVHLETCHQLAPDSLRRLVAIGGDETADLRLTRVERRRIALLRELTGTAQTAAELGYRFGKETGIDVMLLRAVMLEQPMPPEAIPEAARGAGASFPVSAGDLMPEYEGRALGDRLRFLEDRWIASDFTLKQEDLLG